MPSTMARLVAIASTVAGARTTVARAAGHREHVVGGDAGGLDGHGASCAALRCAGPGGSGGHRAGRPGAGRTARRGRRGRPARRRASAPTSSRRSARAPPAVAAQTASAGVIRISRTASATQNGIDEVYDEPGLQSVASATVTPASSSRRASGYGERVENSAPGQQGRHGAPTPASASTSASVRWVQWSALAAPSSTAELHARAGAELVGVHARAPSPAACPAVRIARAWSRVEGAPLAEHVDPPGVRRGGGQHRPADQPDVVVGAVGVLGGHHVRAEEGGLGAGTRRRSAASGPRRRRSARTRS